MEILILSRKLSYITTQSSFEDVISNNRLDSLMENLTLFEDLTLISFPFIRNFCSEYSLRILFILKRNFSDSEIDNSPRNKTLFLSTSSLPSISLRNFFLPISINLHFLILLLQI